MQGDIMADGCDAKELDRWNAEQAVLIAECAVQAGHPGAQARLRRAEQQLDKMMHASLADPG